MQYGERTTYQEKEEADKTNSDNTAYGLCSDYRLLHLSI